MPAAVPFHEDQGLFPGGWVGGWVACLEGRGWLADVLMSLQG